MVVHHSCHQAEIPAYRSKPAANPGIGQQTKHGKQYEDHGVGVDRGPNVARPACHGRKEPGFAAKRVIRRVHPRRIRLCLLCSIYRRKATVSFRQGNTATNALQNRGPTGSSSLAASRPSSHDPELSTRRRAGGRNRTQDSCEPPSKGQKSHERVSIVCEVYPSCR
jgi:hypothetical protein